MSDFTTTSRTLTASSASRLAAPASVFATASAEQRGQTAAEYMGILLFVAVIIGALIAADVDGEIAKAGQDDGRQDRRRQRER